MWNTHSTTCDIEWVKHTEKTFAIKKPDQGTHIYLQGPPNNSLHKLKNWALTPSCDSRLNYNIPSCPIRFSIKMGKKLDKNKQDHAKILWKPELRITCAPQFCNV